MSTIALAFLIGVIAGLRAFMAPAAVSWAAHLGWLALGATSLAFMGYAYTPYILSLLAAVELATDQLPTTPSRKVPIQFSVRIVTGALSGACIGVAHNAIFAGGIAAVLGTVVGTLGGAELRRRLAEAFGADRPAAFIEDGIAIIAAWVIVAVSG